MLRYVTICVVNQLNCLVFLIHEFLELVGHSISLATVVYQENGLFC